MFDIGPSELLLIFVVALLVIGPERLPSAVKTASLWIGRFRRSFHKIKAEVERELNADEIRRQLHNESILAEVEDAKNQAKEITSNLESAAVRELGLESDSKDDDQGKEAEVGVEVDVESEQEQSAAATEEPGSDSDQQVESTAGARDTESAEPTVGSELQQAVSYVNDISREVEASAQEIEDKIRNPGFAGKKKSGDKS
jgi:sec-independent protein translocase protein TatB